MSAGDKHQTPKRQGTYAYPGAPRACPRAHETCVNMSDSLWVRSFGPKHRKFFSSFLSWSGDRAVSPEASEAAEPEGYLENEMIVI